MSPESPFPGMNPYLEAPELWTEVHSRLIVAIADALADTLSDDYRIAIEKRVYVSEGEAGLWVGIPDVSVLSQPKPQADATDTTPSVATVEPVTVTLPPIAEVQERYLEIREARSGAVVTAIELLSPTNKRPGAGRQAYERKRLQVLASRTHLIEIDLLRGGQPLPMQGATPSDYRILVSRSPERPAAQLYRFDLRQPLPEIPVPLKTSEPEPLLALQPLLAAVYRRGRYHLAIDYSQPPAPPLDEDERAWFESLLAQS